MNPSFTHLFHLSNPVTIFLQLFAQPSQIPGLSDSVNMFFFTDSSNASQTDGKATSIAERLLRSIQ